MGRAIWGICCGRAAELCPAMRLPNASGERLCAVARHQAQSVVLLVLGYACCEGAFDVLAFHTTGHSNGPTEGINLLIKKVKRVGHGFRNFNNYGYGSCCTAASRGRLPQSRECDAANHASSRRARNRHCAGAEVRRASRCTLIRHRSVPTCPMRTSPR